MIKEIRSFFIGKNNEFLLTEYASKVAHQKAEQDNSVYRVLYHCGKETMHYIKMEAVKTMDLYAFGVLEEKGLLFWPMNSVKAYEEEGLQFFLQDKDQFLVTPYAVSGNGATKRKRKKDTFKAKVESIDFAKRIVYFRGKEHNYTKWSLRVDPASFVEREKKLFVVEDGMIVAELKFAQ